MQDGSLMPNFFEVGMRSGLIFISDQSVVGTYDILIFGRLESFQRDSMFYTITFVNSAPQFLNAPLPPATVHLNHVLDYQLKLSDPN